MGSAARTLHEIRSEACNAILITLTILGVPAAAFSLLRSIEQGWQPVMALHAALVLLVIWATVRRGHLSLAVRAGIVTAIPYVIATAGLLSYGRGNGVTMFYVSAIVIAGCFLDRRLALGIVALCVGTLLAIYAGYRLDVLALPVNPSIFDLTPASWAALTVGFLAAGITPLIGLSAVLRSLDAERERADKAAKVRSEFLANMSHELRTPMAGVLGMAEVLRSTPLTERQSNLISNLTTSARNLLSVLNDVLDFAKFETGHVPIERTAFRLSELVQNVCSIIEIKAAQKGISLRAESADVTFDHVVGDSLRIGRVLANLLDNAVKFTPSGRVTLSLEQTLRPDGDLDLVWAVTDTGIGIAAEHMHRVFEPFIQADMSASRMQGGTGLGLAICRHLAEAMGGDVEARSQPGQGSTFIFRVPVQRGVPTPAASVTTPEDPACPPRENQAGARPLRLLVADDDENMRILADIMLARRGYDVTIVNDGAAAVDAALGGSYECLILDMHMPGVNGPDVMRAVRNAKTNRRLPMIAVTADVLPEHVRAFLAAGADAVVGKPVDWNYLDGKIQSLAAARPVPAAKSAL